METLAALKSLQCLNFLDANYPRNHLTFLLIFHSQSAVMGTGDSRPERTNQVPLRRKTWEPGAPVRKNVVVLKACDVVERDETGFMPNTIEMATSLLFLLICIILPFRWPRVAVRKEGQPLAVYE